MYTHIYIPMEGKPGVKGSPSLIINDPLCKPVGGNMGPSGNIGGP